MTEVSTFDTSNCIVCAYIELVTDRGYALYRVHKVHGT